MITWLGVYGLRGSVREDKNGKKFIDELAFLFRRINGVRLLFDSFAGNFLEMFYVFYWN